MKFLPYLAIGLAVTVIAIIAAVTFENRRPAPPALTDLTANVEAQAMLAQLLEATERAPDNALARRRLCLALEANGFDAPAIDCYRGLLSFYDDTMNTLLAKTHARLGAVLSKYGAQAEAIAAFERAAELSPAHAPIYWQLGDLQLDQGDQDAAEKAYRRAIEIDPKDPGGQFGLGRLLIQREDFEAAIRLLDDVISEPGTQRYAWYLLGRALRGAGRAEDAARAFRIAGDATPLLTDPWAQEVHAFSLAVGARIDHALDLADSGRTTEARTLLTDMLGGADDVAILNAMGRVEILAGNIDTATGLFLRALRSQPESIATRLNLAAAQLSAGNHLDAARHSSKVIESEPDNLRALEIKGHSLMQLGHFDDAIDTFTKAIELGSPDPMLRIWNATMLCRQGRCLAAGPTLEAAVNRSPRHVDLQMRAITLALAAERPDVAATALANLEAHAPELPQLATLRQTIREY